MDDFTAKHLESWIARNFPTADESARDELFTLFADEYREDPEFYAREGWRFMLDNVDYMHVENAI